MTKQVYTTANGKAVDMGALRLKNERVRAVGNMKVNARGDVIDDKGTVISSKTQQAKQAYNNQVKK
jgi:hypothetical protein